MPLNVRSQTIIYEGLELIPSAEIQSASGLNIVDLQVRIKSPSLTPVTTICPSMASCNVGAEHMCSCMHVASVWSQLHLMGIVLPLPKGEVGVGKDHGEKPSYAPGGEGRKRGS